MGQKSVIVDVGYGGENKGILDSVPIFFGWGRAQTKFPYFWDKYLSFYYGEKTKINV